MSRHALRIAHLLLQATWTRPFTAFGSSRCRAQQCMQGDGYDSLSRCTLSSIPLMPRHSLRVPHKLLEWAS